MSNDRALAMRLKQENKVIDPCDALARLVETTEKAIESGDWKVDGACDPDSDLEYARHVLRRHGWTQNSIDGRWMLDPLFAGPDPLAGLVEKVRVVKIIGEDDSEQHRVELAVGVQKFQIGPDWDTKEEADWYAYYFRLAIAAALYHPAQGAHQ